MTPRNGAFMSGAPMAKSLRTTATSSSMAEVCMQLSAVLSQTDSPQGVLNTWKWPSIEGLHSFKGDLCHTARWPENLSLKDKRVAVIGAGSSGIQVVSAIQSEVKQLYHWIRSPIWITPPFVPLFAGPGGNNFQCKRYCVLDNLFTDVLQDSEEQKKKFSEDPKHALKYRKMIEVRRGLILGYFGSHNHTRLN